MMKRFILRCLLFAATAIVMLVAFNAIVTLNKKEMLTVRQNIVFFGNSTVEYGINDEIIPNSLNMGLNADHIEFIYAKLKMLKEHNPQIDTVYIGLDNIIINKNLEESHESMLMHPYYFSCYSPTEIFTAARLSSFKWFTTYLSKPFNFVKISVPLHSLFRNYRIQSLGIGGYMPLEHDRLAVDKAGHRQDSIAGIKRHKEFKANPFILYFYKRTIDYCRQEGITPVFITMPMYFSSDNDDYIRFHDEYFKDIPLLDFTSLRLPDSLWADAAHLNTRGALVFSRILNDSIRSRRDFFEATAAESGSF